MRSAPDRTEAAEYYFRYIDQVRLAPGQDIAAFLSAQGDDAAAAFTSISEDRSMHRYAPEKWSIRQVLSHVTDTERVFTYRALWFARGFDSPLPSFDEGAAAAAAGADARSWASHVEEFRVHASITICPVTSEIVDAGLFRIPLPPGSRTGLDTPSQVMVDKIVSVPRAAISRVIGQAGGDELEAVSEALARWLDI